MRTVLLSHLFVCLAMSLSTCWAQTSAWDGFRGPQRNGTSLPALNTWHEPQLLWASDLPAAGIGGVAASQDFVLVTSRDQQDRSDLLVCLDSVSGEELWVHHQESIGQLDYGNSIRATPLIVEPFVIIQSAQGQVSCLDIDSGNIVWQRHLVADFKGVQPDWGYATSPLHWNGHVFLQPGSEEANLVAVELATGQTIWQSMGASTAYGSPMIRHEGDSETIICYASGGVHAYAAHDGTTRWRIPAARFSGFRVPTFCMTDDYLAAINEDTGVVAFSFRDITSSHDSAMTSDELLCEMHTPVVWQNMLIGLDERGMGGLVALDLQQGLTRRWRLDDERLNGFGSLIVNGQNLIVVTESGEYLRIELNVDAPQVLDHATFGYKERRLFAHPALVDGVLYVRCGTSLQAWSIGDP